MFHKVKAVQAMPNDCLKVQFVEGITKIYDVQPLFEKWPPFEALKKDRELFSKVKVAPGGYGVVWNEDLDLSCDELFEFGREIKSPSGEMNS